MDRTHLTATERESILVLRTQKYGVRKIASTLNRSPSTISRELQRNLIKGAYSAHEADKLYRLRRKRCRPAFKLEDKELQSLLQVRLEEGWSPEQIEGRESLTVSVTTIYRAVKSGRLSFAKLENICGARASPSGVKRDHMAGVISRTLFSLSLDRRKLGRGFASETGRWTLSWASRIHGAGLDGGVGARADGLCRPCRPLGAGGLPEVFVPEVERFTRDDA